MNSILAARAGAIASVAALSGSCPAQWSENAGANLTVADRTNEQVQAKLAPTPDGGCYISWFDNSTGGYDVYLQRLNRRGVEQWPHNGILIADRFVSSTVDYDLVCDGEGNAVLTYNDDRLTPGGAQQISAQRISPAGEPLWGPNGVMLTDSAEFKGNPHIVALSQGGFVVGYSSGSPQNWTIIRLNGGGQPQWMTTILDPGHYQALSDLKPTPDNGFIALWVRATGTNPITSAKHLYSQRFDDFGSPLWNNGQPAIVFQSTSIQNGYFPTCIPDADGGAIYGWYETGGSRNAYIQHIAADGTARFPAPLANTGDTPGRIRLGAGLAYDQDSGSYYLASPEASAGSQTDYSVIVQKFNAEGDRLWGDTGVAVLPRGTGNQPSFVQTLALGDNCVVAGFDSRSSTTGIVFAARVNGNESIPWSILASSRAVGRSRLAAAMSHCGDVLLAWGAGATGAADIQAQNIRPGGILGLPCEPDFDGDGFLTGLDFDSFVAAFEAGDPCSDFDADGFVTGLDFDAFVADFEIGC